MKPQTHSKWKCILSVYELTEGVNSTIMEHFEERKRAICNVCMVQYRRWAGSCSCCFFRLNRDRETWDFIN
ncbi:hypothetical protein OJAV_G00023810 [Oryzias javanicus]|uniref:Uncharacterized protein n=1 Tax=Oryzias javanicus TaxID=123683 RepID=A0A437DHS3_ORYJA|nr:hypothetical protein OJAV_G00023810 [Oryzias javanicus]